MNGPDLLEHATDLVNRRRREYGEPVDLFERVSARWSLTLGTRGEPVRRSCCVLST
jgi:hypothetical protein